MRVIKCFLIFAVAMVAMTGVSFGAETSAAKDGLSSIIEVQKYFRAIHIMAMLLVGFGFLMVFVKKYGRSAITATYLLVSIAVPLYFLKDSLGILGHADSDIDRLILAEFGAASLLICAGAVLGRLKMPQYILLGLLFVPCYALNEWLLLDGGMGLLSKGSFVDTGGSIVIHAFGALFGLGVAFSMTIVNVIIALCGSTLATYIASLKLRGKVSIADIANAALAGGVAIGSTCDKVSPTIAFIIGTVAGILSTVGFAVIQNRFQAAIRKVDTCGVLHLHGLPGLFGGFAAMIAVDGISRGAQIKGILITIVMAIVTGLIAGGILTLAGRRKEPYTDAEELEVD